MGFKKMLDKTANLLIGVAAISLGAFAFQNQMHGLIVAVISYLLVLIFCYKLGDE
ncbi:MAG: hypothetical protein IJU37_10600 [Desulfovibrio sp.]|nr:hypothetical protein [Desulfovibrio sp.]